jgi:hypothetical protein
VNEMAWERIAICMCICVSSQAGSSSMEGKKYVLVTPPKQNQNASI